MTWRTDLGLRPTPTDLAQDLLKAAERHGLTGWRHDAANDSIRNRNSPTFTQNTPLPRASTAAIFCKSTSPYCRPRVYQSSGPWHRRKSIPCSDRAMTC